MNHVLDENGNRVEGLSKEEIYSVIQQAIANGSLEGIDKDSAFVSKLKCCVGGVTYKIAFVTEAQYNELFNNNQLTANTLYYITDDKVLEVIFNNIDILAKELDATNDIVEDILNGSREVTNAINAIKQFNGKYKGLKENENGVLKTSDEIISKKKLLFSSSDGVSEFSHTETLLNKKLEITLKGNTEQTFIVRFTGNSSASIGSQVYNELDSGVSMVSSSVVFEFSTSTPNKVSVKDEITNISTGNVSQRTYSKIIKVCEIIE